MHKRHKTYLLIAILCIAALTRLIGLSAGDPINDETSVAFRAVGPLDFDLAEFQTTPLEWFDPNIPSWTKLSFHDHPPLSFWIEHIAMGAFGESRFGFRIGAALFGIYAVWLLYRIGTHLYNDKVGLLSAAFLAITLSHVHYSRIGMQESFSLVWILLAILLTLKAKNRRANYVWAGGALGLALLTKYTALFFIPAFLAYILLTDRSAFRKSHLWGGITLLVFVCLPVIVYNLSLYRARGHFDFQFSYLFGQDVPEWQVAPGKETGTLLDKFRNFTPWLIQSNSWLFLSFAITGIAGFLYGAIRKRTDKIRQHLFLLFLIVSAVLMTLITGPAYRFLVLLTPLLSLVSALALMYIYQRVRVSRVSAIAVLGVILMFEMVYTANNELMAYARGPEPWLSSPLRVENEKLGYSVLDDYIEQELLGKYPGVIFLKKYDFLKNLQEEGIVNAKRKGARAYHALFVYDQDIFNLAQLWIYDRRLMYHGWPFIPTEQYYKMISDSGPNVFKDAGFTEFYFIAPRPALTLRRMTQIGTRGPELEVELAAKGIKPHTIINARGEEVFRIYRFTMQ